jgi:hypothetical protein
MSGNSRAHHLQIGKAHQQGRQQQQHSHADRQPQPEVQKSRVDDFLVLAINEPMTRSTRNSRRPNMMLEAPTARSSHNREDGHTT